MLVIAAHLGLSIYLFCQHSINLRFNAAKYAPNLLATCIGLAVFRSNRLDLIQKNNCVLNYMKSKIPLSACSTHNMLMIKSMT